MSYLNVNHQGRMRWWTIVVAMLATGAIVLAMSSINAKEKAPAAQPAPALTVQVATVSTADWPETLQVSGPIVAWQEAIIGAEIAGQRLAELRVNVGDQVKKGQVLARYNTDTLQAEVAELQAIWQQADADRARAVSLQGSGAMSNQQIESYTYQAAVAKARLDAKALQLRYATVIAPDDGIISSRTATLGAIGASGGELFRMILNNRLEWRGTLNAQQLAQVKTGQKVTLTLPDGSRAQAKIRQLSPSLDAQTRMATLYADIQPGSHAKAGMYANGTIAMQIRPALVVPAVSVVIRDGRPYVFVVANADANNNSQSTFTVAQRAVTTGRSQAGDVEIVKGLSDGARVIMQGAGFLNEGDVVRVVAASPGATSQVSTSKAP
jgi:RND family efflux transporter MFP subunit